MYDILEVSLLSYSRLCKGAPDGVTMIRPDDLQDGKKTKIDQFHNRRGQQTSCHAAVSNTTVAGYVLSFDFLYFGQNLCRFLLMFAMRNNQGIRGAAVWWSDATTIRESLTIGS